MDYFMFAGKILHLTEHCKFAEVMAWLVPHMDEIEMEIRIERAWRMHQC